MIIRTRFAPSPTGSIHLGNIRTALFSWLYARHRGGQFILRIEDTDQERSTQEAIQLILDSIDWLGIDYDEGPYYQTKRMDKYHAVAQKFIDAGLAYRCYCSKERLNQLREEQFAKKEKPRYDGHCRDKDLPARDNEPYVIRFKNPLTGTVSYEDQVLGNLSFENSELDDLVIIRADGFPTYNFCVVVDDLDMKITHVIRGADHVNNTPRQINIFRALGAEPPVYGHVPLILGSDGKLLSKRHGAASVLQYRDEGYLPEAMLNYLVRLGWSHGDQEIFSREEMISLFDVKDINRAAAAFNPEKLTWINRHYIKTNDPASLSGTLAHQLQDLNIDYREGPALTDVIMAQRERSDNMREMAMKSRYFFEELPPFSDELKSVFKPEMMPFIQALRHRLEILPNWTDTDLHQVIEDIAKQFEMKLGKVAQPVRIAVTGSTVSPPLNVTLRLIGKKRVLERLDRILSW